MLPLEMNACLPGCVWNATPRSLSPLERTIGFWTQAYLILMAIYQEKDYDITHTYSCEVIAGYDDQELSELFKDHNIVTLARLILSDLPAENLYEQMKVMQ